MTEPDKGFYWVETISNDDGDDYPDVTVFIDASGCTVCQSENES